MTRLFAGFFLFGLSAVVGCEGRVSKLQKLETERDVSCLHAQRARFVFDSTRSHSGYWAELNRIDALRRDGDTTGAQRSMGALEAKMKSSGVDTLESQAEKARVACELATRDYDSFGR